MKINLNPLSNRKKGPVLAYWKGYKVNNKGIIFNPNGEKLNVYLSGGYYNFCITLYKRFHVNVPVHRFVALKKFGNELFQEGIEVRHLDGNSLNNKWENIEIGTHLQNVLDRSPKDRYEHAMKGVMKLRKLTMEQANQLRKDKGTGMTHRELMKKYKVLKSTVSEIVNNKIYKK